MYTPRTLIQKLKDSGTTVTIRLNPYIATAAALTILLTIITQRQWPDSAAATTLLAIHLLAVALTAAFPRPAGWTAIITLLVSAALPYPMPQQTIGICVALAVLGFSSGRVGTVSATLLCILGYTVATLHGAMPDASASPSPPAYNVLRLVATAATCVVAAVAGQVLRRGKAEADRRKAHQRDTEQRLAMLQHDAQLAIAIHDTLTNDLTFISTIARLHLPGQRNVDTPQGDSNGSQPKTAAPSDDPVDHDDASDWALVLDRSQRAFNEVHHVIDYLSGHLHGIRQTPFMERLSRRIDDVKEFLTSLGYDGQVNIHGIHLTHAPEAEQEALSLIREIGTNIRRHAVPGDDAYLLDIACSENGIEIREINGIADAAEAATPGKPALAAIAAIPQPERSGRGLQMHRRRIAELGGELNTNGEDGAWILYARIPCTPPSPTRPASTDSDPS